MTSNPHASKCATCGRQRSPNAKVCAACGSLQAEFEITPIVIPDLNAAQGNDDQDEELDELARFHRDPYASGGSFWANALRDLPRPAIETAPIEELADALGKDPDIQEKLNAFDEEFDDVD